MQERRRRSFIKGISWRFIGTADTVIISYFITGHVGKAFSIGTIELITKFVLYYLHERAWMRVPWGQAANK